MDDPNDLLNIFRREAIETDRKRLRKRLERETWRDSWNGEDTFQRRGREARTPPRGLLKKCEIREDSAMQDQDLSVGRRETARPPRRHATRADSPMQMDHHRRSDDETQACRDCGEMGHRKPGCSQARTHTPLRICHSCGNAGHLTCDCPSGPPLHPGWARHYALCRYTDEMLDLWRRATAEIP